MCHEKERDDCAFARIRLLGRLVAFPTFAVLGYAPLVLGWPNQHWLTQSMLVALLSYSWYCIGGLSHELIHGNLKTPRWFQRTVGRMIGTFIAIPYTVYRESHLRHHAYLNTPLDTELWPYSNPNRSLTFRRTFVWFDVIFGVLTAPLIYGMVFFQKEVPLRPEVRRKVIGEYVLVAVFWLTVATGFAIGVQIDVISLSPRVLIYVAPLAIASSINSVRKLTEHLGMSSYDPVLGTRTLIPVNPFSRVFSYFNFDLAVHGPHHRHPRLPHTALASKMREYEAAHPTTAFPVYTSMLTLLRDTLACMIRNPGVGANAGGHTDLGHLPGLSADSDGECLVNSRPEQPNQPDRRRAA